MAENIVGLGKLNRRLDAIVSKPAKRTYLRGIATTGVHEARAHVRHRTGKTARRIKVGRVTEATAQLRASGAAAFLEGGVPPHLIGPKGAKALAFAARGVKTTKAGKVTKGAARKHGRSAFAIVRKVHHPGMRKQPFLRPAAIRAIRRNEIAAQLVGNWNKAA